MGLFQHLPSRISICEVSPRDGLQNEALTLPTHAKVRLIEALADSGLAYIEMSSFVSPRWVPQLADAADLARSLPRREGVVYAALCPNRTGLRRAIESKVDVVAVFLSVSETHNRRNVNKGVDETLRVLEEVVQEAVAKGLRARAYISTVWGCPFEGSTDVGRTLELTQALLRAGAYEISLGDTVGVATPKQVQEVLDRLLAGVDAGRLALHFHDTRGTALANVLVGLEMGITTFDASVAGLGGCPYAPGAAGNLATEDLVYALQGMGIETGVDLDKLWEAGKVAEAVVGRPLPGKVHRAGVRSLRRESGRPFARSGERTKLGRA